MTRPRSVNSALGARRHEAANAIRAGSPASRAALATSRSSFGTGPRNLIAPGQHPLQRSAVHRHGPLIRLWESRQQLVSLFRAGPATVITAARNLEHIVGAGQAT